MGLHRLCDSRSAATICALIIVPIFASSARSQQAAIANISRGSPLQMSVRSNPNGAYVNTILQKKTGTNSPIRGSDAESGILIQRLWTEPIGTAVGCRPGTHKQAVCLAMPQKKKINSIKNASIYRVRTTNASVYVSGEQRNLQPSNRPSTVALAYEPYQTYREAYSFHLAIKRIR